MNRITQEFIKIPSLGGKTVRINGDFASVYDLLMAAGVSRARYRTLSNLCERFPCAGALLTKTRFTGASAESLAIHLDNWAEFGDFLQKACQEISPKTLKKLNKDLDIMTIDVPSMESSSVAAIAPAITPDVSVTDYGKTKPAITDGKLVFPELNGAGIRSDGDRFSVYDFLKLVCGKKNPRDSWTRISERHSEVVGFCDNLKFPGRGQRQTVVTDREGLVKISQVLPGEFGAKFRADAAKIILAYLDADLKLAGAVVDRAVKKGKTKEVEQHIARTQGIILRKQLTSALAEHGVNKDGYRLVTNAIYIGLMGKPASALRKDWNLEKGENLRPHMTPAQWMSLGTIETAVPVQLKKQKAWGNEVCAAIAHATALQIGQLIGLAA